MSENQRTYSGSEIAFLTLSALAGVVLGVLVFLGIYFLIRFLINCHRKSREKTLPAQFRRSQEPEEKVVVDAP